MVLDSRANECDICRRQLPTIVTYFAHLRTHPEGELARVLEPRLFTSSALARAIQSGRVEQFADKGRID